MSTNDIGARLFAGVNEMGAEMGKMRTEIERLRALTREARGVLSNCIEDLSAQPNSDSGTIAEARALLRKLIDSVQS